MTDVTRLNFFEVARAAFFSKYYGPKQVQRSSARRASPLTMDKVHIAKCLRVMRDALVSQATASERAMVRAMLKALFFIKSKLNTQIVEINNMK